MKKKRQNIPTEITQQALEQLEQVLIDEDALLPENVSQISDEEMALYGKGTPMSVDDLKRAVENSRALRNRNAFFVPKETTDSLAIAARNGEQISQTVWQRMHDDRDKAEQDNDSDD